MRGRKRRVEKNTPAATEGSSEPTVAPEVQKAQDVAAYIRKQSREGLLVSLVDLSEEPMSIAPEKLDGILARVREEGDIKAIHGKKSSYLFCEESMSHSFAKLSARLAENDLVTMLAEQVREDSRIYPRPTPARQFYVSPFNIESKQLVELLETLKKEEEYSDIESFEATNGALYLYSRDILHPDQARAIAQMQEVEEPELFF